MCFLNVLRLRAPSSSANFLASLCASLLLAACGGGGGGGGGGSSTTTITSPNVITVTVDSGPAGSTYQANRLFTDVTICAPGTSNCQTLDHVLVDTGSSGLRVLASALTTLSPQSLPRLTGATGNPLLNCVRFLDNSFTWGPVVSADVKLGSETAPNIPMQLVADSSVASASGYNTTSTTCSFGTGITKVTGTSANDAAALGAKGILGVGYMKQDCGAICTSQSHVSGSGYYECTNTNTAGSCTATAPSTAPLAKQVKNPVPLFSGDNNGLVVVLPAVTTNGGVSATTLQGSIVFGVDTQSNNSSAGAVLLQLDNNGYFTATLNTLTMPASFLDTGSNGLFFDTALVQCVNVNNVSTGFYCPANPAPFNGTFKGSNNVSKSVSFTVSAPVFALDTHVFPQLGGTLGDTTAFDAGLPFFYGRKVFVGFEGTSSSLGTGAYYGF
jgi:hypothetical protein